ncbi:MAG TPA: GNAT family N-acetyltransferase [Actinocrinis sp.]|nr:GNAT family N-acetyltransferase [Actinocrinis sp.]
MTDADTKRLDLLQVSRQEAARIAAGRPGPEDRWAEGFPREDDSDPAGGLAGAAQDPAPFGVYALVPRGHGRTIGTAGFFGPPDAAGEVTIGYGMVEPEWGQGYGTAAVAELVEICRAHGGVSAVNADTDLDNIGSQRVLEKNGFERVRSTATQHYFRLVLTD